MNDDDSLQELEGENGKEEEKEKQEALDYWQKEEQRKSRFNDSFNSIMENHDLFKEFIKKERMVYFCEVKSFNDLMELFENEIKVLADLEPSQNKSNFFKLQMCKMVNAGVEVLKEWKTNSIVNDNMAITTLDDQFIKTQLRNVKWGLRKCRDSILIIFVNNVNKIGFTKDSIKLEFANIDSRYSFSDNMFTGFKRVMKLYRTFVNIQPQYILPIQYSSTISSSISSISSISSSSSFFFSNTSNKRSWEEVYCK